MTNQSKMKVYQEVLNQIRQFIEEQELKDGDRLPSERELSEQLNASRASIREALRAIELLGLIETRHGEGTFLRTYKPYHSVELLSTFVLREVKTKDELLEVKFLLEQVCLNQLFADEQWDYSQGEDILFESNDIHTDLFLRLFEAYGNRLLLKIWHLVTGFVETVDPKEVNQVQYEEFLKLISQRQYNQALDYHTSLYEKQCS
ncbi:FadR/GntR family transcriptional regulator [Alkalibacillus haloalkaliphilus]|uniref:FadR/GntR family transcriptional regulator n=1 Tax=Alkalibacillus haloalkaliphilus TaxID=94136 RepID=UPI002936CE8C|nr:GntR family transcriptional regulator [Alkalibacillus haloalkaliphilus]MDV2581207.1 GntR family transcriptional regulator [Alkalibacillus haloalkaliphilus]